MDILDFQKAPSVASLVDSDIVSVDSLQYLDIEELDEAEYALPPAEDAYPSLEEILNEDDDESRQSEDVVSASEGSALHAELLQGVSQQLKAAEERTGVGPTSALAVGAGSRLTAGTAHGHVLTFQKQTLRWACSANKDHGAVSAASYSDDASRLLVGFARGLIVQYECSRGIVLRKITPGGGSWGVLRVCWAGAAGLCLDTGGSVWLMRFSRPLGVRSARASCLFSGARGEVVALAARDARMLAMATLSRVIVVAGGKATAAALTGPTNCLPAIAWRDGNDRVLLSARGKTLQWHLVSVGPGDSLSLKHLRRVQLKMPLLWMGWLGPKLALLDTDERLRLWDDEDSSVLDLSAIKLVYATQFFKGVWMDGRVSRGLAAAGAGALGGAATSEDTLILLGRCGVVRVRARSLGARAEALASAGRWGRALALLLGTRANGETVSAARDLLGRLAAAHCALSDPPTAEAAIQLCVKHKLADDLWGCLWDSAGSTPHFLEALGAAAGDGLLVDDLLPPPSVAQALVAHLADSSPKSLERVLLSLPLVCLDPHQACTEARRLGLWRAAVALGAALGGYTAPFRDLAPEVKRCRVRGQGACSCPGDALLLHVADGLGGRVPRGALPSHAQPAHRHETLSALLREQDGRSPSGSPVEAESPALPPPPLVFALLTHDALSMLRMLELCFPEPPFVGPLGRQNRLRTARALVRCIAQLQEEDKIETVYFLASKLSTGALPPDKNLLDLIRGEIEASTTVRADEAWLCLLANRATAGNVEDQLQKTKDRPRIHRRILEILGRHDEVLDTFLSSTDDSEINDMFEYLYRRSNEPTEFFKNLLKRKNGHIVRMKPSMGARFLATRWHELLDEAVEHLDDASALIFTDTLQDIGVLSDSLATKHFRLLCVLRPESSVEFLKSVQGSIRPEDALKIVKEHKVAIAESYCLEAVGDVKGALESALKLVCEEKDENRKVELAIEAGALCSRLSGDSSPDLASELWTLFVSCKEATKRTPPSVLLEGAVHVPFSALVANVCSSNGAGVARDALHNLLLGAARRALSFRAASRVLNNELHVALARNMRKAGKGLSVRSTVCVGCFGTLQQKAATRVYGCGHAVHAECSRDRCLKCGRQSDSDFRLPASTPRIFLAEPFALKLTAPPRPDLEGAV